VSDPRPRIDPTGLSRWGFADPGPLRDELTAFALAGGKTTTASLLVEYTIDGDDVPVAGQLDVLVDSQGRDPAIVETIAAGSPALPTWTTSTRSTRARATPTPRSSGSPTNATGTATSTRSGTGSATGRSSSPTTR
jgi:hypothetical protein